MPDVISSKKIGLSATGWWAFFALSTFALSLVFEAFRDFTMATTFINGLALFAASVFFTFTLVALLYDSYAKEKNQGKVANVFGPFEALYEKQLKALQQGEAS